MKVPYTVATINSKMYSLSPTAALHRVKVGTTIKATGNNYVVNISVIIPFIKHMVFSRQLLKYQGDTGKNSDSQKSPVKQILAELSISPSQKYISEQGF